MVTERGSSGALETLRGERRDVYSDPAPPPQHDTPQTRQTLVEPSAVKAAAVHTWMRFSSALSGLSLSVPSFSGAMPSAARSLAPPRWIIIISTQRCASLHEGYDG
jgi:hypothetical protein